LILTSFDPVAGKGKELMRIPAEPDYRHWAISPDGKVVAFLREHWNAHQISFIPVGGGETRTVDVKGYFLLSSLEWAPDSRSVFVGTEESRGSILLHIDLKGNAQPIWQESHRGPTCGVPSPDGRHLLIGGLSFNTNVWLVDNF
jgi:Tol biopolymer transport system component